MVDTSQRRRFLQCPRCGAENLPTNKFCGQCGANLRGETPAAAATTMAPKAGTLLPYTPGAQGPGRGARLALVALVLITLFCTVLLYFYLASGADRSPRPTPAIPGIGSTLTLG